MQNYKDLLVELTKTNFKLRYNNSVLGFVWVLIKPFATFWILYMVWTSFRGNSNDFYQVRLLLGIILFNFIQEGIIFGMNALLDKAHIILKVSFPRVIAVQSSILMAVINLVINLGIFVVFAIFNATIVNVFAILYFLIFTLLILALIYGVSLFLSIFLIKLRDLQHIFELIFQLLFWLTPIFFTYEEIAFGNLGTLLANGISIHPISIYVEVARSALIYGEITTVKFWTWQVPSYWFLLIGSILATVIVYFGIRFFNYNVKRVAEHF